MSNIRLRHILSLLFSKTIMKKAIKTTKKPDINNTFNGNISLYIAKEKVITVKTINKNENIL